MVFLEKGSPLAASIALPRFFQRREDEQLQISNYQASSFLGGGEVKTGVTTTLFTVCTVLENTQLIHVAQPKGP